MINYYDVPDAEIPMSMRVLRRVLAERGWKAEKVSRVGLNDLILTRPDGKVLKIASSTPPTTSVYALHLADNKLMTYELLKEIGVLQPETIAVDRPEDAREFLKKYPKVVVKPVDGAHGDGVTTGIKSLDEVGPAIEKARAASPILKRAIMQPQLASMKPELRVICIDYKFVLAAARIPAAVTGDGVHTVRELIKIENGTIRTKPYASNLAFINEEAALRYLGERAQIVPGEGQKVRVLAVCNTGQGGTMEDYSNKIPEEMKRMAERIAKIAELPVIGVDLFDDQVVEVNAAPALYHPFDDVEKAEKCVVAYADYLEKL